MSEQKKEMQLTLRTIENKQDGDKMVINFHGARIEQLLLDRIKILADVIRGDGKRANTHPCIPEFGPDKLGYELPQHGSARNTDFRLNVIDGKNISMSLPIKDGKYPEGLSINQLHSLSGKKYTLITSVLNSGKKELPVNFAEHFYWYAPNGWEDLVINGIYVSKIVRKDSSIRILPKNEILIPGQRPIILEQKGFSIFQLWAYKNPQTGEYDKNYVCIEPAEGDPDKNFFGSEKSMIKPNQSRITEIIIKLK